MPAILPIQWEQRGEVLEIIVKQMVRERKCASNMRRNYWKNILKGSEEMYFTDEEKDILSGARGEAAKLAMETLIKSERINGAEKFVPIKNVHLVLHAYKSRFRRRSRDCRKNCPNGRTLLRSRHHRPHGMDAEDWRGAKTLEHICQTADEA